jgi:hypothetical protein
MAIARDLLHELFVYDNGVLRNKISRGKARAGNPVGCPDSYGYLVAGVGSKVYKVHRLIYAMFNDVVPAVIDHINGDPADNRIENLRPATVQQNSYNRKVNRNSSTKVRGVSVHQGKWMAQCQSNGKRKYLGVFSTLEQATLAVREYKKVNYKEFARND